MKKTEAIAAVAMIVVLAGLFILIPLGLALSSWRSSGPVPHVATPDITQPAFTDHVQHSLKGVVHIACPQWQGSGFVIGPRLIVTARHCVEDVEDFLITTHDGHQVQATRAISDKSHDVAFIWVDNLLCVAEERGTTQHEVVLTPLPIGSIKDCVLGQSVYVIGSPYGKINLNSLTTGIISGVNRDWSPVGEHYGWEVAFTVDSAGHPGNSGCPVFTRDGVVRGILVGGFSPVLISVMPCDLFLGDLESIRLMFAQDRYQHEEAPEYSYEEYPYGSVIEEEDK
jgi:S1-C subfamily serine protease